MASMCTYTLTKSAGAWLPMWMSGSFVAPGWRMALHHGVKRSVMFAASAHAMLPFLLTRLPSHLQSCLPPMRNHSTTSCMSLASAQRVHAASCWSSRRSIVEIIAQSSLGRCGTRSAASPRFSSQRIILASLSSSARLCLPRLRRRRSLASHCRRAMFRRCSRRTFANENSLSRSSPMKLGGGGGGVGCATGSAGGGSGDSGGGCSPGPVSSSVRGVP